MAIPNELLKFGSPLYGMIALIPLFKAIHNSKSFNEAGLLTGLQIFLTHVLSSYWLVKFKDFAIFTLGASALAYFFFGFVFGNYIYAVFYYTDGNKAKNPLRQYEIKSLKNPFYQIIGFASIWTIYEWFKSTGWLAYPWGTLFMSAYRWHHLKQICAVTGTLGITYLMALFAAVIAKGLTLDRNTSKGMIFSYRLTAIYCIVLFVVSCSFGVYSYKTQPKVKSTLNITIVQHNGDPWNPGVSMKNIKVSMEETDKALAELAEQSEKCDLVVWNESTLSAGGLFPEALDKAFSVFPRQSVSETYKSKPFSEYVTNLGIPLLSGGPAHYENEEKSPLNAAILFGKDGKIVNFYGKSHLVPFAEEIPYADTKFVQNTMERLVGFSNGWTAGKKYVLFQIEDNDGNPVYFATPICFEDAFPDLCRELYNMGSDVFVNITNDSWSETNSAEYQHFVVSSFRAIEHRTSMIRSCTAGYSVVLNSTGDVIDDLPLFETTHKNVKVPIYERSSTIFSKFGNWIMTIIFIFTGILFVKLFLENIRKEKIYQNQVQALYEESENEQDEENGEQEF